MTNNRDPRGRWEAGNRAATGRRGTLMFDEPTAPVTVRFPMSVHARLVKLASKDQRTVASLVRSLVTIRLP